MEEIKENKKTKRPKKLYIIVAIIALAAIIASVVVLVVHLSKRAKYDDSYKFEMREGCSDFYYSHLSENQQKMYRMLYKEADDILFNGKNKSTLGVYRFADFGLSKDEAVDVWFAFRFDAPVFFMISNYYVSLADSIEVTISSEFTDKQARDKVLQSISDSVERVKQLLDGIDGDALKFKIIYDYVMDSTDYKRDENGADIFDGFSYSMAGALDGDKSTDSICQGYSSSISYLCNLFGVECIYVSSGYKKHSLNIVKIGESWYYADATYDDTELSNYSYFLNGHDYKWGSIIQPGDDQNKNRLLEFLPQLKDKNFDCNFVNGGLTYRMEDKYTCYVARCEENVKTVSVPSKIGGMEIRSISMAFNGCKFLTDVEISDGIKIVGGFLNCSSLKSVLLPSSVTTISGSAFSGCSSLTSINLPDGLKIIGSGAFKDCVNLTSVELPSGVTRVERETFYNCPALTSVKLPDGITSIGDSAFYCCSKLTEIDLPDGITSIGSSVFYNCSELADIDLPDALVGIGSYAFYGCSSLTSIFIPRMVSKIDHTAFYDCNALTGVYISDLESWCNIEFNGSDSNPLYYAQNLYLDDSLVTELVIPDSVTQLKDYVFYNCSSLTSVELHGGIATVGNSAFHGCSNLKDIIIPDRMTSIGGFAFRNCDSLAGVYISDLESWCNIEFDYASSNPLYYAKNLYLNGSLVTELVIPDSVTQLNDYAFYNCRSLTSVELHGGITSVGKSAFSGCSGLTSLKLSSGLESIGAWAFSSCASLTELSIPDGVTFIGNGAFSECRDLTRVEIPLSVTQIGQEAFSSCHSAIIYCGAVTQPSGWDRFWNPSRRPVVWGVNSGEPAQGEFKWSLNDNGEITITGFSGNATEVVIPSEIDGHKVTSIADYAFYNFIGMTSISIPETVTSIGQNSFTGCKNITQVAMPTMAVPYIFKAIGRDINLEKFVINGGDIIDETLFYDDWMAYNIEFGVVEINNIDSIGSNAFRGEIITSLKINNVTTIGESAFRNCKELVDLEINNVETIGKYAFQSCENLTSLNMSGIGVIEFSAFSFCSSLTSVKLPYGITKISNYTFDNCGSLASVEIPSSVTSIGMYAFEECFRLTEIVIPSSVTSIEKYAFWLCTRLTIYCEAESQPSGWYEDWNVYYINGADNKKYYRTVQWNYKAEII